VDLEPRVDHSHIPQKPTEGTNPPVRYFLKRLRSTPELSKTRWLFWTVLVPHLKGFGWSLMVTFQDFKVRQTGELLDASDARIWAVHLVAFHSACWRNRRPALRFGALALCI